MFGFLPAVFGSYAEGLPATTVFPAVTVSVTVSMSVRHHNGGGGNDHGRRTDDDCRRGGNDDGRGPDDNCRRGGDNDRLGCGLHHHGLRRRIPTTFVVDPLTAFLRPARLNPDVMGMRRVPPVTGHPNVALAAPLPVTRNPDVLRRRHRRTDFDLRCGRSDDNADHLGPG